MIICKITESSELGKLLSGKHSNNLRIIIDYLRDANFDYAVISNSRHFIDDSKIINRLSKQEFMYGPRKVELIQYNNPTDASKYSNILYESEYNKDYVSYILANYVISKSLLIRTLTNFLRDINLFETNPFDEIYYHAFLYVLLNTASCIDICSDEDVIRLMPDTVKDPEKKLDMVTFNRVADFMVMLMKVSGLKIDVDDYKRKLLNATHYI